MHGSEVTFRAAVQSGAARPHYLGAETTELVTRLIDVSLTVAFSKSENRFAHRMITCRRATINGSLEDDLLNVIFGKPMRQSGSDMELELVPLMQGDHYRHHHVAPESFGSMPGRVQMSPQT